MLNSVVFMVRKGKKKSNLKANPRLLKFSVFSTHTPLLLFQAPRQLVFGIFSNKLYYSTHPVYERP